MHGVSAYHRRKDNANMHGMWRNQRVKPTEYRGHHCLLFLLYITQPIHNYNFYLLKNSQNQSFLNYDSLDVQRFHRMKLENYFSLNFIRIN